MYKHILLPADGSEVSARAVDHCVKLAKSCGARLTAVVVVAHAFRDTSGFGGHLLKQYLGEREAEIKAEAQAVVDKVASAAKAAGVTAGTEVVLDESPYTGIIAAADKLGCDLIVMASHGRRGLGAVVLGSETTKVLTHSKVPVLVVR